MIRQWLMMDICGKLKSVEITDDEFRYIFKVLDSRVLLTNTQAKIKEEERKARLSNK